MDRSVCRLVVAWFYSFRLKEITPFFESYFYRVRRVRITLDVRPRNLRAHRRFLRIFRVEILTMPSPRFRLSSGELGTFLSSNCCLVFVFPFLEWESTPN